MQTIPIQPTPAAAPFAHAPAAATRAPRACYGLCCSIRRSCGLWHAVERPVDGVITTDHCGPEHALFEAVLP
jgi:hypothetical protein